MMPRFQWKLILYFTSLCLLLLLLQGYLIDQLKWSLLASLLISLLIALPISFYISNIFTDPIQRMTEKARQLVSDRFLTEARVDQNDELRVLSKAMDEMDVQIRKKIEEISKERDYLQTILKGMAEGVLVVDSRSRILMTNEALRKFLSLSYDVTDRIPLEIIRNAALEEAIQKVIKNGTNISFELNIPISGGKTLECNVVSLPPSSKEVERGAIAVFHDITRLKELEKIRQDFVANVSHELRTPLTTIKGYAETLLEGALKEEVAFGFVQVIKRHTDRLTKIVEDLLILSKIESKKFLLQEEGISIPDLISDVMDYMREAAEKKKISIDRSGISPGLFLEADRNYLEQVFVNLIDNSIKYTQEGGKIAISAIEKNGKEIEFSIKDNGIGIPKEDLPRIFERFYRVDKGRSQELGGTGLGLSIVKHIVQAHCGRVWAESQLGEGSTFYFTLPRKQKIT
ncbi:MAG: ATP-binding protein [Deltaproteobacteria bacterium]|nr:ATP-binding protein [Deltaproteobacteria bacterium]